MTSPSFFLLCCSAISLTVWIFLTLFRGDFWKTRHFIALKGPAPKLGTLPSVAVIIPARNEAELIPRTLPSILNQDYKGSTTVILVDDQSTDGTSEVCRITATTGKRNQSIKFKLIRSRELPSGWSGKLWAMECGLRTISEMKPDYILFTDADILHPDNSLSRLVAEAETESLQLSSVMVHLKICSLWDRLLLPAFIYFFAKLYPFAWTNDPSKRTAGAAGGCILVRREALEKAGGLFRISGELIDDCAMAKMIKGQTGNLSASKIKLQLCREIHSLRPCQSLESTWSMVRRTAFTQLGYSVLLLAGTLIGMILIYVLIRSILLRGTSQRHGSWGFPPGS